MVRLSSWVMRPRPITSWVARYVLLIVVGFWTWFSIASGIGETAELGVMALLMHLVLPAALIALLVVCWRWEFVGGVLLIIAAAYMTLFFGHLYRFQEVLLMLELPIALLGVLLIYNSFDSTGQMQNQA